MAILDARLEMLLARRAHQATRATDGPRELRPDDPITIGLKFTGDIGTIAALDFQPVTIVGQIAFGRTTLAGLEALARHPHVGIIEAQRRARVDLDGSVPDIKANILRTRTGDAFTGHTGRGVIVGIVDTGIDFRHHTFRKPDGTSRVLKIWDQTLTALTAEGGPDPVRDPDTGAVVTALGYGVEYDQRLINETLQERDPVIPVRHVDKYGHGTHVAGIAAGDGSQSGRCHLAYHYVGVAPEADLMVVRQWGLTPGDPDDPPTAGDVTVDAVNYLMDQARQLGRPIVINMSFGTLGERLDGSALDSQAIDELLRQHSTGRAIVFSAGNSADRKFRADGTVPGAGERTLRLNLKIFRNDDTERGFLVRYVGAHLQVRVMSPIPGPDGVIDWLGVNDFRASLTANGPHGTVEALNLPNRITVRVRPPAGGVNRRGEWAIELRTINIATPIEAFCLEFEGTARLPRFTSHITTRMTTNQESTGFESIAVGAYREGGPLSEFSGRGPTLDNPPRVKPELAAPGEDIASAGLPIDRATSCRRFFCECCQPFYIDESGTSMSAAHVSGVIALMLHKNPTLTHTRIRELLIANAGPKNAGAGPDEDLGWGAGRVDAKATLDAVAEVNPPVAMTTPAADSLDARNTADASAGFDGRHAIDTPHPLEARDAADAGDAPMQLSRLRDSLLATPRGTALIALFEQYGAEVWTLVQHNRRVATIWHRCKGPVWLRLALKAMHAPDSRMRLDADGLHLRDSLRRFADALKRFGSPALRRDVQAWESEIARIEDGMSLHALIDAVGNPAHGHS